jgi:chloride channel 3/4/5
MSPVLRSPRKPALFLRGIALSKSPARRPTLQEPVFLVITVIRVWPTSWSFFNPALGGKADLNYSIGSLRNPRPQRHHGRRGSWGERLVSALSSDNRLHMDRGDELKESGYGHDRVWYDQFTSTDWVHDSIADAYRVKELKSRKDFRGRLRSFFDGSQGWILSALVGCITAIIAYGVDVSEGPVFDIKDGYCSGSWHKSQRRCCAESVGGCEKWTPWSDVIKIPYLDARSTEFVVYIIAMVFLATASCFLTMTTKTVVPSTYRISTLDENLGALNMQSSIPLNSPDGTTSPSQIPATYPPAMTYYTAAGSGVAEVRVILSGFVLHGFLGVKTLIVKTVALVLSVASGLSLGKEGPYVHIATCVGNIACRLFTKYDRNDGKRREVLSAAAASGVAVAFGAPIGGVLFSLEEVSYFFPPKTLFRTFFCCITAALSLKFLNPYGTNKIVMFEVRYLTDWEFFEMVAFISLGVLGGAAGALFIKASRLWAKTFRQIPTVKKWPIVEVILVALTTGLLAFWNPFTKPAVAKLLFNLASPCEDDALDSLGLCPDNVDDIMGIVRSLTIALIIKSFLTVITFGIVSTCATTLVFVVNCVLTGGHQKVPAGIYVPSMVVGGLMGRIVGHLVQWLVLRYPGASIFGECAAHQSGTSCITPGVYALIAAGSTMCGVTRLSVTLAVILFELTGSLDYVLPFSLAILVAKWTADAMEPLSIYDLLTAMNEYPFLNNKHKPVFTSDLADITPRVRKERIIDITVSPLVPATSLRQKLRILHEAGELDGGLPILRDGILVGLIPAPDLEFALDTLHDEERSLCLMARVGFWDESEDEGDSDPTDFTPYIDSVSTIFDSSHGGVSANTRRHRWLWMSEAPWT